MRAGRTRRLILLIVMSAATTIAMSAAASAEVIVAPTPSTTRTARSDSEEMVAFLSAIYLKTLESRDWIDRSLALVSLARMPGDAATETILKSLKTDPTPAVRVVAWQCLLARAPYLDEKQWKQWREATSPLVQAGAFRGPARVGLLRMLAAGEPSPASKRLWRSVFHQTSSRQMQDIPVLDELGKCLVAWRSRDLLQFLFETLGSTHDAYRAEYVLHTAGVDAPWAGERSDLGHQKMWQLAIEDYARWWQARRAEWKEVRSPPAASWRKLEPQYVPRPDLDAPIDRHQPGWKKEMEIGTPDLRGLDVAFVIDATGSMQWVLDYFKSDVARILRATSLVSTEPRIGLTFYRDHGDAFVTRSAPLTAALNELEGALAAIDARGGGDRPEAVLEGLSDAIRKNNWGYDRAARRRAVVLIGDAPPQPQTQATCQEIARQCAERDIALYAVNASGNELAEFDAIAAAAGRAALEIDPIEQWRWPYDLPKLDGNRWHTVLAAAPAPRSVDRRVLGALLGDAINPQFADRVAPIVDVMLALTSEPLPEKREVFGIASPESPRPPVDPQAR